MNKRGKTFLPLLASTTPLPEALCRLTVEYIQAVTCDVGWCAGLAFDPEVRETVDWDDPKLSYFQIDSRWSIQSNESHDLLLVDAESPYKQPHGIRTSGSRWSEISKSSFIIFTYGYNRVCTLSHICASSENPQIVSVLFTGHQSILIGREGVLLLTRDRTMYKLEYAPLCDPVAARRTVSLFRSHATDLDLMNGPDEPSVRCIHAGDRGDCDFISVRELVRIFKEQSAWPWFPLPLKKKKKKQ